MVSLDRGDQPGGAVGDDQQRAGQPAGAEVGQEGRPGVGGLGGRGVQPDEHRLAGGGDAPRGQHRLGRGADVVSQEASVDKQVIQLDLMKATLLPGGHLGGDLGADPRHRRARHRGALSEGLGQGGLYVPGRQAADEPAMTRLFSAWVLVTPVRSSREANASLVPRSFGRDSVTGPVWS
jgi:hypothetical protein